MSLGIKNLNMSPNGHYLTVGFYDQTVRLYNHITWKLIIDFQHQNTITDSSVNIFREEEIPIEFNNNNTSSSSSKSTKYVEVQAPVKLNSIKPQMESQIHKLELEKWLGALIQIS
jgi:hypothetical protein